MEYLTFTAHQWVENALFMSLIISFSLSALCFASASNITLFRFARQILGFILLINSAYYYHAHQQWLSSFVHHSSGYLHIGLPLNLSLYDMKWVVLLPLIGLTTLLCQQRMSCPSRVIATLLLGVAAPSIMLLPIPTIISLALSAGTLFIYIILIFYYKHELTNCLDIAYKWMMILMPLSLMCLPLAQFVSLNHDIPISFSPFVFAMVDNGILITFTVSILIITALSQKKDARQ